MLSFKNYDEIRGLFPFRKYRKEALTYARLATEEDVKEMGGVIQSKEGPVSFAAGDYFAVGIEDEMWRIRKATMESTKEPVAGAAREYQGQQYYGYRATNTVEAAPVPDNFQVTMESGDVLSGQPGDYLLYNGKGLSIVNKSIFEQTYIPAD